MQTSNTYNAALYCRLSSEDKQSEDDDKQADSLSIQTQKMMLEKYCQEQGFNIVDTYIDDGYTGTNFNRPSFQRLINDIEKKKVNLVLTKDLSRLGRNYIMTGHYTEIYFPSKNVRYIALNDGIDTSNDDNDIAPFKNILNDMYSKDISKKVRAAKRSRALQGLYIGCEAPYGYIKDPNNRNRLIIDEPAAEIVRYIFKLSQEGMGICGIATKLTKKAIPIPSVYKANKGQNRYLNLVKTFNEVKKRTWSSLTVLTILKRRTYIGETTNLKREIPNYKTTKVRFNPPEKWIVVPYTHEAIIPEEEFNRTQELLAARQIKQTYFHENLFKGLAVCGICNKKMILSNEKNWNDGKKMAYKCNTCARTSFQPRHFNAFGYDELKTIVTARVNEYINLFKNDENFLKLLSNKTDNHDQFIQHNLEVAEIDKRLKTLLKLTKKIYEDFVSEVISEDTYKNLTKEYELEQKTLKYKYDLLTKKEENSTDLKAPENLNILTKDLLNKIIDKIEIHSEGDYKKKKKKTIKILYKFTKPIEETLF